MFIADTHSDTLYAMGVQKAEHPVITPERLREGGISLQVFALWTGTEGNKGDVIGIMEAEMSQVPKMRDAGLRQVFDPSEVKEGENCFMLSIEGGEPFESGLGTVADWYNRGVRMAAISWNHPTNIASPAKGGSTDGLTAYGVQVVKEMQRLGMAVDTSHLNEAGFYDILSKTDRVPMASHSCCKTLCGHCRNLSDDQIKALIRNGGYIGINFYPYFLSDDGKADLARVVEHIDYICQMGGDKIVGLGSDFDGIECSPEGLEDPRDVPGIFDLLRQRGYSEDSITGIAGENLRAYYNRIRP